MYPAMNQLRIEDVLASPYVDRSRISMQAESSTTSKRARPSRPSSCSTQRRDTSSSTATTASRRPSRSGANTIPAELRRGSREDALRDAVELAAAEQGVSPEMARARIRGHCHGQKDAKPES